MAKTKEELEAELLRKNEEAERLRKELAEKERGESKSSFGLSDLFSMGFWGILFAGLAFVTGGLILQTDWGKDFLGEENWGLKAFANKYLNWGSEKPIFEGAEEKYFITADAQTAADLIEDAISSASESTLGRHTIETMTATEANREMLVKMLKEEGFNFAKPNFDDAMMKKVINAALTKPEYRSFTKDVLSAVTSDIISLREKGDKSGIEKLLVTLGLAHDNRGKSVAFTSTDTIAKLLSDKDMAHVGVSFVAAIVNDEATRRLLEQNKNLIAEMLTSVDEATRIQIIQGIKDGKGLPDIVNDTRFDAARKALFDKILADNSVEENLGHIHLKLLSQDISEQQAALAITFLRHDSEMPSTVSGQEKATHLDILARLMRDGTYVSPTTKETVTIAKEDIPHVINMLLDVMEVKNPDASITPEIAKRVGKDVIAISQSFDLDNFELATQISAKNTNLAEVIKNLTKDNFDPSSEPIDTHFNAHVRAEIMKNYINR